ncbi:MAG: hypothetical protein EOO10_23035 [Chitinophagaceae bacterium]|nr:MAG: hypothetical protein EOO10_23035 [Chitinophagaceae bacterium]
MNIQNIVALAEQLKSLGFTDMGYSLAKRACFKPKHFFLNYQVEKSGGVLRFQLSFEKDRKVGDAYVLVYYDAIFQKSKPFEGTVNGVDVSWLSQQMSEVDWTKAFDFTEKKPLTGSDKNAFEKELRIESIIDALTAFEGTNEGRLAASFLKQEHWLGTAYNEIYGNISVLKNKVEVSQRFYILDGQPSISVDEACRYLQNRWLEKEMLAKKKQAEDSGTNDTEINGHGTGLLRKKRKRKARTSK